MAGKDIRLRAFALIFDPCIDLYTPGRPGVANTGRQEAAMAVDTVDPAEVAKFEAMAAEWWDPKGKFKPLHMLNPCRLDYITSQIAAEFGRDLAGRAVPFKGLRLLDIGCGGGLLSEPMARLGADVVGADAASGTSRWREAHAGSRGWRSTIATPPPRRWRRRASSSMWC
jgi:hypothetical protein